MSESIVNQIKDAIYSGQYKPGDRLPSEQELHEILSVGRPVVREALRSLEHSGLISVRSGSGGGAFVQHIDSSILSDTFKGIISLDKVSVEQITDARMTVEMAMLPHVFERIDASDIAALEENVEEAKQFLERGMEEPKNLQFHILLSRACKNPLLTKITEAIFLVVAEIIREYSYSYERKKKVLQEHQQLLKLLKEGHHTKFMEMMSEHIGGFANAFK